MFVVSTPRTGSTLYCELTSDNTLNDSLSSKLATGLYNREIFDVSMYSQLSIRERFDHYIKLENKPLIKVFPGMTPNYILDWLFTNMKPIYIERKDKLDQILSWGLGTYTRKWNTKRNTQVESLEYLRPDFQYITTVIDNYNLVKQKYKHIESLLLYTEDIKIQSKSSTKKELPQENSEPNKLEFYVNKAQILEWYDEWNNNAADN